MLYHLLFPLQELHGIFNIFQYITFRTIGATMTAMIISFMIGPYIIRYLRTQQPEGQPIRDDGPLSHIISKKGTPTMGGILILISLATSTLLWGKLTNIYLWMTLLVTVGFGLIGAYDDYLKLKARSHDGLSGRKKLLFQTIIALAVIIPLASMHDHTWHVFLPVLKNLSLDLGLFFVPLAIIVIIGSSNAVNLTDGLDGLAIVPSMIAFACFGLIAYVVGNIKFADYLQLYYIAGTGELAIFCGALIGSGIGFLWFNTPPAKVFMGDTGSLSMGGALGTISVITKHELLLAIIGGVFVIEALSVMIQVASFKLTGKRVFKMAPIHHHFEKEGWSEPTIVIRFWIIAFILALVGLSTLKLR